jgi:hypothetical protein
MGLVQKHKTYSAGLCSVVIFTKSKYMRCIETCSTLINTHYVHAFCVHHGANYTLNFPFRAPLHTMTEVTLQVNIVMSEQNVRSLLSDKRRTV